MAVNRKWKIFTILTLIHGIVVYFFMYKMAIVSLTLVDQKTVVGCVLWIIYGAASFWIMNDTITRRLLWSALFGICVFLCKGIVDMVVSHIEEINSASYMEIAKCEAVTNILFGTILILIVRLIAGNFRESWNKAEMKWLAVPALIIIVTALAFVYFDMKAGNAISMYQYNDMNELYQIDAQYAVRFLKIEVWLYVLYYSALWFALDKMATLTDTNGE